MGRDAARSGLEALGAGLEDGNPGEWTVDRHTAAAVSEALGGAVAGHASLIAGALERAAVGDVGPRDGDVLRGLGYLTLDEDAARSVANGLRDWGSETTGALAGPAPVQIAAVGGAFVATREYGQRLAYALHGFEQQAAARQSKDRWDVVTTVLTLPLPVAPARRVGRILGSDPFEAGLDYAAMVLDWDGVWDNGVDDGLRFGRGDAVRAVLHSLPHDHGATDSGNPGSCFLRRGDGGLGRPLPPTPPVRDYVGPLIGGLRDIARGLSRGFPRRRIDP